MFKLLKYIKEYKIYAILTPFFVCIEVLMDILIPYTAAKIIDIGITANAGFDYIVKQGMIMLLMAVVSLIFGYLAAKYSAVASIGFAKNLRQKLFDKVQDFSFSNIDKFSTASLVTRMTTDINNIQNAFMMIIKLSIKAPLTLFGATLMAVFANPRLSKVFIFAIVLLSIGLYFIVKEVYPRFKEMLKRYDLMNLNVQENLIGIRVVKSFVREGYEEDKFENSSGLLMKAQIAAEKLIALNMPLMQLSMYICILAILWFGGNMVIKSEFAIGQLSTFISYVMQILMSLMLFSLIFIIVVNSKASISRIVEILDEQATIKDSEKDEKLKDGSIEFKNVNFSYLNDKNKLILRNINLKINPGETIGIIGSTGSGKTTLVQLLPRLYDILDGEIIIGQHNIKDYKLDTLRTDIAMVLQKNLLFSGTIKENLLWGNENATDEEIKKACQQAQAADFIELLPDKYETELGQGGINISGGQKQRLCIARALLKKPKILILDDSTSAVDTATEGKIRAVFKEDLPNVTKIVIAQRVLSIRDSDKIIIMNNGEISDMGTHDELIKRNEIYKELYESQQNGAMK